MKRIYYVSRFANMLRPEDLEIILNVSVRNNLQRQITGFLVCLGDTFFQVLEGPDKTVDRLFFSVIVNDPRHKEILCLKSEAGVTTRLFPDWHMKVFDLNAGDETLPFAFRQMLTALLESQYVISQYTQPSVFHMLEKGINPTLVSPCKKTATVFFSDIIGFSLFSQWLTPRELIEVVNSHIEMCTQVISQHGGEVNKLTGDGLLAYFSQKQSDGAIAASLDLLQEMKLRREKTSVKSPLRYLYGGVGLAHGTVYEGNIGFALKRDFTILGNTVNLASRLESYTRELEVRFIMNQESVTSAKRQWKFISLGKHRLKGQSTASEIFSMQDLDHLNVREIYRAIEEEFSR
jgi:class 3 adenylate cyclase